MDVITTLFIYVYWLTIYIQLFSTGFKVRAKNLHKLKLGKLITLLFAMCTRLNIFSVFV